MTEDRHNVEDIREMIEEIDHLLDIKIIIDITEDKYFDFFKFFFCTYYRQLMFGATQLPSSKSHDYHVMDSHVTDKTTAKNKISFKLYPTYLIVYSLYLFRFDQYV